MRPVRPSESKQTTTSLLVLCSFSFDNGSFDETTLSILTSPNACGTHVEVQVDDVVFVGHTLGLEKNKNLKSFAIFFALRVLDLPSMVRTRVDTRLFPYI
jgi:hypothetical protein